VSEGIAQMKSLCEPYVFAFVSLVVKEVITHEVLYKSDNRQKVKKVKNVSEF
jgi:hypothetical protein